VPTVPTIYGSPNGLVPSRDPHEAYTDAVRLAPGSYPQGQALGEYTPAAAANEVQTVTVTGTPTGGTFRLAFNAGPTAPLPHNATAAAVQAALEALPDVGAGNVVVTGSAGGPWAVTFQAALGNQLQATMTLFANSLTGGSSPAVGVAKTTPGRSAGPLYGAYDDALANGLQACRAFLKYATVVYPDGTHQSAGGVPAAGPAAAPTATAYFTGTFYTSALVGLDANGVADVGRLVVGTAATLAGPAAELRMS
jgi:hypothetical protein